MDRALRSIHQRRCGLDAEEARWLREAEALQIWRPLGMVSALDYMERALGYAPRTAQDKLRVARALGSLPRTSAALGSGALAYSAVRELTRVATAATEEEWVARSAGMNLRQIEELVADHHHGDRPDDPKDPAARTHLVRFEVKAETFALLRQARQLLDEEHATSLSEDQLLAKLCSAVLDGPAQREPTGRARFQIAITVCERCEQGWQHGAGAKIALDAAAVERAMCDAQQIGSIDGAAPEKAHQDVSPSVARFVWHRDGGRCRVPGCRSARGLEIHHLVRRADGGGHDAMNLAILCSACHQSHHAGTLTITGTADQLVVRRPGHVAGADGSSSPSPSSSATNPRQAAAEPSGALPAICDAELGHGGDASCTELANRGAHVGAPRERTSSVAMDGGYDDERLANRGAHVGGHERASSVAMDEGCDDGTLANRGAHVGGHERIARKVGETASRMGETAGRMGETASRMGETASRMGETASRIGETASSMEAIASSMEATANDRGAHAGGDDEPRSGRSAKLEAAMVVADAKSALRNLGWEPRIVRDVVAAAVCVLGAKATLEQIVVEALRRCPRGAVVTACQARDGG